MTTYKTHYILANLPTGKELVPRIRHFSQLADAERAARQIRGWCTITRATRADTPGQGTTYKTVLLTQWHNGKSEQMQDFTR